MSTEDRPPFERIGENRPVGKTTSERLCEKTERNHWPWMDEVFQGGAGFKGDVEEQEWEEENRSAEENSPD